MTNISRRILRSVTNEVPTGNIDGINNTFTLQYEPIEGTLVVILNGLQINPGSGNSYILNGKNIIFSKPPKSNYTILANYYR